MNFIFFDTETTGLPKNYKASPTDLNNWPRIIQLAWELCDENGNVLNSYQSLIKPDGWVIPVKGFWIKNGFCTEINEVKGKMLPLVFGLFIKDLLQSNYMVAHNMGYDYPIIASEMIRYNVKTGRKLPRICTMLSSKDWCNLPRKKWPKLEELHGKLFGCNFEGATMLCQTLLRQENVSLN